MKKACLFVNLLVCLLLAGVALGDQADNGLECTIKLKANGLFDVRDRLPDFTLVFTNKGKEPVRLYDGFYPSPTLDPHISIKLFSKKTGEKVGWYLGAYNYNPMFQDIHFITLNPGEKHEVPIKDVFLLVDFRANYRLSKGEIYLLEVDFMDERGDPGVRREYKGKTELYTKP